MNSALLGAIVGILGGLLGTYFSIKNTSGPRERRFMIKAAVATWAALGLLGLLLFTFPEMHVILLLAFFSLVPLSIVYVNRHQTAIREHEQKG